MSITNTIQIRRAITEKFGKLDYESLDTLPLETVLNFVNENNEGAITDLSQILFRDNEYTGDTMESLRIIRNIQREDASIKRINSLYDIDILGCLQELGSPAISDLSDIAIDMFIMPFDEYKNRLDQAGLMDTEKDLKDQLWYNHTFDSTILLGVLRSIGESWSTTNIKKEVLSREINLGYFTNMFELKFNEPSYLSRFDKENIAELHSVFMRFFGEAQESIVALTEFDAQLKKQHKLEQPQLLENKTINSLVTPYSIAFNKKGDLIVMGQLTSASENSRVTPNQFIVQYNLEKKDEVIDIMNTGLCESFRGAGGGIFIFSYNGQMNIGSNGTIFVNGGEAQLDLDSRLTIESNDSLRKMENALQHLKNEGISTREAYQMIEKNGTIYVSLDGRIVAADENGIVGNPLNYNHNQDGSTEWDPHPRIFVTDTEIIYRDDDYRSVSIKAVNKDLSKESIQNAREIICESNKDFKSGCKPSNFCVGPDDNLYVVTKLLDEPVNSIKIHNLQTGELLTHIYPEGHPGGWANFRSMAIRDDGLLAYSSINPNNPQIHFYQITMPDVKDLKK